LAVLDKPSEAPISGRPAVVIKAKVWFEAEFRMIAKAKLAMKANPR